MKTEPPEKQHVLLELPQATIERYTEAAEEVKQTLGLSPGREFLMALAIANEDPFDLSTTFLGEIVEALREQKR